MTEKQVAFLDVIVESSLLTHYFSRPICEFIACQFALESDFGLSRLADINNNITGMKVPFKRPFYGCKSDNGFACYSDWFECIKDYIVWFFYSHPHANCVYDLEAFKIHLHNSGYCPEKGYIDKIQFIYSQFKSLN